MSSNRERLLALKEGAVQWASSGTGSDFLSTSLLVCLFLFASVRALSLSITHDEAITVFWHAQQSFSSIVKYKYHSAIANNHLLNTLLIKILVQVFGYAEIVVRLPALTGFILYLAGVRKTVLFLAKDPVNILAGIFVMSACPFLFDFFSAARGYSLALGFLIWAIYYYLKMVETSVNTARDGVLFQVSLVLSVLANCSFLNPAVVLLFLYFFLQGLWSYGRARKPSERRAMFKGLKTQYSFFLLYSVPLLGYAVWVVFELARHHDIVLGGSNGFWPDTVASLIRSILYERSFSPAVIHIIISWIAIILLAAVVASCLHLFARRAASVSEKRVLAILLALFGCSLCIIAEHIFFGVPYAAGRAALYLIPLFLLCFLQLKYFVTLCGSLSPALAFLYYAPLAALVIHSLFSFNASYFHDWKYDAATKKTVQTIMKLNTKGHPISLGISWQFEPSINYYRKLFDLSWMSEVTRDGIDGRHHYCYVLSDDREKLHNNRHEIIKHFKVSDSYLAAVLQ